MASEALRPAVMVLAPTVTGADGLGFTLPVTLALAGLLAVPIASYRQVIAVSDAVSPVTCTSSVQVIGVFRRMGGGSGRWMSPPYEFRQGHRGLRMGGVNGGGIRPERRFPLTVRSI
ncbi:hypothetical protein [Streptomyces sp. NPDC058371]|uniref:hypothetical protein n=1 Tax=Streptomyces sp. NPDC058371 TaxID=3346463 RepID=UPI00364CD2BD